jgi:hypothetical protein
VSITSPSAGHATQVRIALRLPAKAQIMKAQSFAVGAGLPRPTYSDVINALLAACAVPEERLVQLLRDEMGAEGVV